MSFISWLSSDTSSCCLSLTRASPSLLNSPSGDPSCQGTHMKEECLHGVVVSRWKHPLGVLMFSLSMFSTIQTLLLNPAPSCCRFHVVTLNRTTPTYCVSLLIYNNSRTSISSLAISFINIHILYVTRYMYYHIYFHICSMSYYHSIIFPAIMSSLSHALTFYPTIP